MGEAILDYDSTKPGAIKEDALVTELKKNYRKAKAFFERWEEEAKSDYDFALGKQWDKEDQDALKAQGRPCLTFNRIRPIINVVSGYQRENSARIKVNPEGGEDRIFSEVMDRAVKAVDKWSHFSHKAGYWFDDGLYCGKGWLEAIISYDRDPIRGELQFKQRKPGQIRIDPDFLDYDLNEGCQYLFKTVRLTKQALKDLYPNKQKLIDGFVKDVDDPIENGDGLEDHEPSQSQDDNYGSDKQKRNYQSTPSITDDSEDDGKFTVYEYWRPKRVQKFFVIDLGSGEPTRFNTEEEAQAFITKQGFGKIIKRNVPEMWVAAYVCGFIVEDQVSPFEPYYSGFPFFRFIADWAPNADDEILRVQGITRPLKDAQREKNKAKSQYLHIINTQANSGWIGDEDALTPGGWETLEKMGSKPGLTVKKKKGYELREIQPKGPNQSHLIREEKADMEFKEISNVNPDLMGIQDGTESGRAISMRIKQAVLALVRIFSNYRYSKEIVGRFILQMTPMMFDTKKLMKTLGPDYMAKAIDKVKYPGGLSEGHLTAFLQMVKDNKYDVFVAEADQNSTIRYEIFQELTELMKAGAPIPPELIVDYMDLPNSQEVKDKIVEYQQMQAQLAAAGQGK